MARRNWENERAALLEQIKELEKREGSVEGDDKLEKEKKLLEITRQRLELQKGLEVSRRNEAAEALQYKDSTKAQFEDARDAANAEINALNKSIAGHETREKQITKEQKALESTNSLVDSIGVRFGLASSKAGSMSKNIFKAWGGLVKTHGMVKGSAKMMQQFAKSVVSALHPLNVIESLATAIWKESWELFQRFSKAVSSMNATIGDAGDSAKAAGKAINYGMGVEIEQATKAAGGLAQAFTNFTSMGENSKASLIGTAAELERVGISAGMTGEGMNTLTRSMGMTAKSAEKQWKGMAASAASFGKTPAQFASDFKAASGVLMAHGPKMMGVFKDLAATAKATGMSMDKLLSVAAKFDTFDSAAGAVGNLNALLGGDYLNTLEMMNMTENERIQALKGSLEMAGKNFDQMERFERKAIAEQMGMDEAQLAATMKSSGREARKARRDAKAKEKDQKRYSSMVKTTVDIMHALKMLFTSLFAHKGLMGSFGKIFKELFKQLKPNAPLGKGIRQITGFIGDMMSKGILLAIKMFKKWMGSGKELTTKIGEWKDKAQKWFAEWETGGRTIEQTIDEVKTKVKAYVVEMLGLGGVFGGEGTEGKSLQDKMKTGVEGMVTFVKGAAFDPVRKAFTQLILEPMGNALEIFAKSMKRQAAAADPITGAILGKIGAMAGAAGIGIKDVATEIAKKTPVVTAAATAGFSGMEQSLMEPLKKGVDDGMSYVNESLEIGSPSKVFIAIGKSINDGFAKGLDPSGIQKLMESLVDTTDDWVDSLKEVADQVRDIAVATTGKGGAGAAGKSRVVLELDGKVLAEYIVDTFNKKARQLAIPG